MFGSAVRTSPIVGKSPLLSRNAALAQELNSAAMEGDSERVKQLLEQVLQCRDCTDEPVQTQVAALEALFYSMRTMAITDELTGVYNRRGFDWVASRLLRNLARDRQGALLIYADVDNLKAINDTLGHSVGDRHLKEASAALRRACGDSAIIGRIGGDEFALLARQTVIDSYSLLRRRIQNAVLECNTMGHVPPLSMSIGVAEFDPLRPASVLALLDRADRAMYAEKNRKTPAACPSAVAPRILALAASGG